jgi:cation diffusion facilitator CzcD-associated flavoprotein CzcO
MADTAAHVTMLQRSPTYIVALPDEDPIANVARKYLPRKAAYAIARWKNVLLTLGSFQLSRRRPQVMKTILRAQVARQLPPGYDIDTHFKPNYNPWDQRMCLVPNGDLFKAIREGKASVVTDQIETFTETGLKLASGAEIEADVIITATGLNLLALGGMELVVDGEEIALPDTMGYKGMMLSGIPNLAVAFGYTNASWTLKCDLTCEYVCRLLKHMDANGYVQVTPQNDDPSVVPQPFLDLSSGYVTRSADKFPKQGSKTPWRLYQNYPRDIVAIRYGTLDDGALQFRRGERTGRTAAADAQAVAA